MHRILIADPLDPSGLEILKSSGAEIQQMKPEDRPRLAELLPGFDALIVRSATQVTADLLRAGRRLKVVGRAGIGVDNVDVAAATELGVLVVNAPTANLISATEHTFALLLALARKVAAADRSVQDGEWTRKKFLGVELQGRTLGVIGFGRIGQEVARRAQAFDMRVVAYDPYLDPAVAGRLNVEMLALEDLLSTSDVVTLHTPLTDQTRNLIDRERLALMKPSALLINCARGGVVDEEALLTALEAERLGGAALDVFENEPLGDLRLVRHAKVVATPHIGAQTQEAQERVSTQTARMVLAALEGSLAVTAVNLPFGATTGQSEPYLNLAEQLGKLASRLLDGGARELKVDLWGIEETLRVPVMVAVVKGALTPFLGEAVNYVNAEKVAASRGIEVIRSTHTQEGDYPHLMRVRLSGEGGQTDLSGTLFAESDPRVVRFGDYRLEFNPHGRLLFLENSDVPGVVGKIGTLLGSEGVNIAGIHLARNEDGEGNAVAVLQLDQEPDPAVLTKLTDLAEVEWARMVDLGGQ